MSAVETIRLKIKIYLEFIGMVFQCQLCQKSDEWLFASRYCSKCQRIKHLLNLYGDEVYDCLETVLVRTKDQQSNKIKTTIKPVIERKLPNRECKKEWPDLKKNKKDDK